MEGRDGWGAIGATRIPGAALSMRIQEGGAQDSVQGGDGETSQGISDQSQSPRTRIHGGGEPNCHWHVPTAITKGDTLETCVAYVSEPALANIRRKLMAGQEVQGSEIREVTAVHELTMGATITPIYLAGLTEAPASLASLAERMHPMLAAKTLLDAHEALLSLPPDARPQATEVGKVPWQGGMPARPEGSSSARKRGSIDMTQTGTPHAGGQAQGGGKCRRYP